MTFEKSALIKLLNRLIPADEFPGAWESGAEALLVRLGLDEFIQLGLAGLEAEARLRHGRSFLELNEVEADDLIARAEEGKVKAAWPTDPAAFIARMIEVSAEAFYTSPESWDMIGYKRGLP